MKTISIVINNKRFEADIYFNDGTGFMNFHQNVELHVKTKSENESKQLIKQWSD